MRAVKRVPTWRRTLDGALRVVESKLFKLAFVLATLALGVYSVVGQWSDFESGLSRLGIAAALEAFVCVIVALYLNMLVWRLLLAGAGSRLSVPRGSRIFFIGQLGKYMPGSVWPVLTQMELGRASKVPRERSASTAMLSMMIGLASGLLATLVGMPFMAGDSARTYWWVFLFVPALLVCLHPRVLNPVIAAGLRRVNKPIPEALPARTILVAVTVNLGAWICCGAQIWVLMSRLGASSGRDLLVGVGAYALAWCVGFVIVLAPAGAGVREAILVAVLTPFVGHHVEALAIALVSRGLTMLADLAAAGVAALISGTLPASSS
jgi:uncharacterized membrane protein YbhN (UPF0104 family)